MKKINKLLSVFLAAAVFSTALATLPINKKVEKVSAAGSIVHPGSAEIARSIADEGTVLLRNQGALPLKKSDRVALVGGNSMIYGGGGSGWVNNYKSKCSLCHGRGTCVSCTGRGKIHGNF